MTRGDESRILLEIEVSTEGGTYLADTGDIVSVQPLGNPTTIFIEDDSSFTGKDIFHIFREQIRDNAPRLANGYSVQQDHPDSNERLETGSRYYRSEGTMYIPVQYWAIDGKSVEKVLERSFD